MVSQLQTHAPGRMMSLTLKVPEKLQLYGLYVYYVVHICDCGMLRVNVTVDSKITFHGKGLESFIFLKCFKMGKTCKYHTNWAKHLLKKCIDICWYGDMILPVWAKNQKFSKFQNIVNPTALHINRQILTRSIRDSETSIDFVQGPPGSLRERVNQRVTSCFNTFSNPAFEAFDTGLLSCWY